MEYSIFFFVAFTINTVIGYVIGNMKGRPREGMWLGFFIGPLGWLIVAVLDRPQPPQPVAQIPAVPVASLPAAAISRPVALPVAGPKEDPFEKWEREQDQLNAEPVAVAMASPSHEAAKLERLRDLFSQGLITDDEYAAKRQQILAEM